MNSIVDDVFTYRNDRRCVERCEEQTDKRETLKAYDAFFATLSEAQKKLFSCLEDQHLKEDAMLEERFYREGMKDGILLICEALYGCI